MEGGAVTLKRRADQEPLEGLLIACKRKKSDLETTKNQIPFTTVFKFAGTVRYQDDAALHIGRILRKDRKKTFGLRHIPDVTEKLRTELRHLERENRLKVVNCFRNLKDLDVSETEKETEVSDQDGRSCTVLDVVSCVNNGQESNLVSSESQPEQDPGDVYDVYYTSVAGSDGLVDLDNLLSVHPLSQSHWEYQDPEDSSDSPEEDDDDPDDENNWRNDYPDSDHSFGEDDMSLDMQMGDLNLSYAEDLSSGDED